MLPQNNPKTIHINPNFRGQRIQTTATLIPTALDNSIGPSTLPHNAHINPLFLEKTKIPTIHMNPRFLLNFHKENPRLSKNATSMAPDPSVSSTPINKMDNSESQEEGGVLICKSKTRLIRQPIVATRKALPTPSQPQPPIVVITNRKLIRKSSIEPNTSNYRSLSSKLKVDISTQPIIVKTKRKLIRKCVTVATPPHTTPPERKPDVISSKTLKTKYKLDNRTLKKKSNLSAAISKTKRKGFVGRFALLRRNSISSSKTTNFWNTTNIQSMNKKIRLLNINGLLYKSTRNSLQLKDTSNVKKKVAEEPVKPQSGLTIFVRGTKYIMDPQKFKLTRVLNNGEERLTSDSRSSKTCRRRIDIGGYTYVSGSSSNVLVRTSNHLSRAYVHNAKQKSLQLLTRRLVKSNVPCPIYQRVGKCAAYERGKCSKVHNKQQVAICPKFLRGECVNSACLMSHEVSLSKMPVCKFYMQGVCVRNDCPYLHKKLSSDAAVCLDFLRGFCQLADKCKRRHEFVCPELERSGVCTMKNCLYCKSKLKKDKYFEKTIDVGKNTDPSKESSGKRENSRPATSTVNSSIKSSDVSTSSTRYFLGISDETVPATSNSNVEDNSEEATSTVRYFIETSEQVSPEPEANNEVKIGKNDESQEIIAEDGIRRRPQLGVLPAFIPL
ncbi:zinc finger CCCH domain-containing protein 3 [Haematobia irritans]|uniref:zinc finger CCCH domain-containing protein 3 n=1 Tax=Haematobia irritans TaxID=7368 RepID=UPI003F4FA446